MKIELAHGAGGEETSLLIHNILRTVMWTKYLVTQAVPAR